MRLIFQEIYLKSYTYMAGISNNHRAVVNQIFKSGFVPINGGGRIHLTPTAISLTPPSTLPDLMHPPSSTQPSYSPPPPVSSMSSLVVPFFSNSPPQNPMPFSKHDHHPSSTHAHTNAHCLPLLTDPPSLTNMKR